MSVHDPIPVDAGRTIQVTAPCKINLTLDVGLRRSDGYHDLDSIVMTFSPSDALTIRVRPGRGILLRCDDTSLPTDSRNLVYRAAESFLFQAGLTNDTQVAIDLAKRVPIEAGLGGGSSDAATTLLALDRLFPGLLSFPALLDLGATIGSDVPLFLRPDQPSARLCGRGEQVVPLADPLPLLHGVLVKPEVGVSTKTAYALLDATVDRVSGEATRTLLATLRAGETLEAVGRALGNDFEEVVLPAFPPVAHAHQAVQSAGAVRALLCGSGSAVFGLARNREHARALVRALRGQFAWVKIAAGKADNRA